MFLKYICRVWNHLGVGLVKEDGAELWVVSNVQILLGHNRAFLDINHQNTEEIPLSHGE